MTVSLVQTAFSAISVSATFPVAPTNGNLLIAMIKHWANGPTPMAGWTQILNANGATGDGVAAYYKYAGAGEPTTQQPASIAGSGNCTAIWELTGVTGVFATDVVGSTSEVDQAAGASAYTNTSFNTAVANDLVLGLIGASATTAVTEANLSLATGQTTDNQGFDNTSISRHATNAMFHQYYALSATAVQHTATYTNAQTVSGSVHVEIANATPPVTAGGGGLTLKGVG